MWVGEALRTGRRDFPKQVYDGLGKHRCLLFWPHGIVLSGKHVTTKTKCFTSAVPCSVLVHPAIRDFSATVLTLRLECSFVQRPLGMEMVPSRAGWDPDMCPRCRGLWGSSWKVKWTFPVWYNWVDAESQLEVGFWKWPRASRSGFLLQSLLHTLELILAQK